MNSQDRYRSGLGGAAPSPGWRKRTLEAMEEAGARRHPLRRPLRLAAGAAALALVFTGGVWLAGRTQTSPNGPGVARTPEPVATPTPPASPADESFLIVADVAQQLGNNPTAGHLYELTQLPVYQNPIPSERDQRATVQRLAAKLGLSIANKSDFTWHTGAGEDTMGREPALQAQCTDGTNLRLRGLYALELWNSPDPDALEEALLTYLTDSSTTAEEGSAASALPEIGRETLEFYNYDGSLHTTHVSFLTDPQATLEEKIYSYNFQRIQRTGDYFTLYLPTGSGTLYPLRSPDDAQAAFRAGDYWGSNYTACPDQAQIIFICLEYDITQGQPYIQPVYRILYAQSDSYWDLSHWTSGGTDASSFLGVGVAYVPAVDPQYQEEIPYRRYYNDGLAHHIPEETG